ncbi:hypothetical protein Tco_0864274 [Tanacetum coccineum]
MAGSDDEIPPPPPPPQTPTQQAPHTVSTIKLPILKKGEYDIWAMKMEHYLSHTDYPIWEVIQKGNGPVSVSTDTNGVIKVLPPKTATPQPPTTHHRNTHKQDSLILIDLSTIFAFTRYERSCGGLGCRVKVGQQLGRYVGESWRCLFAKKSSKWVKMQAKQAAANRISLDPDRTWMDGILRFMRPVSYGPTTLPLSYSDRKESLSINL